MMARLTARSAFLPFVCRRRLAAAEMAASNTVALAARVQAIDHCRRAFTQPAGVELGPVWQYWGQGEREAPAIVRLCLASVRRHVSDRRHMLLTDETIADHVALPPHILAQRDTIGRTQFSDFLRLALLATHGGTWIDATVMLTAPIPATVAEAPFFVFSRPRDPYLVSSWFMHARAGHPLIRSLLHAQNRYYESHDRAFDYFMLHHMVEALVTLHRPLAKVLRGMPHLHAYPPHDLQNALGEIFDAERFRHLLQAQWLHKLTYKVSSEQAERVTIWDHLQSLA